jgi:hypothetical protein
MEDYKEKTLCDLQEKGFIESDTDKFKSLIKNATHFCMNCGRSAARSDNLCNPEKL